MIDVIVPAKDAQILIDRLLSSLNIQIGCKFKVTIVYDNPITGTYKENIRKFPNLDIQEMSYGENRGCGWARQYGIDHTNGDIIIFADTDDYFCSDTSLFNLTKDYKDNEDLVAVTSSMQIYDNGHLLLKQDGTEIWLHGKSYKRSFIREHHITFYPNSMGEDAGWNRQVFLNAEVFNKTVGTISIPTYTWTDFNKENRINTIKFAMFESKKGLIDNMLHVIRNANINNLPKEKIIHNTISFMLDLYAHYVIFLGNEERFTGKELDDYLHWCLPIYNFIKDDLEPMEMMEGGALEKIYQFYQGGIRYAGIKCSLQEFFDKLSQLT